MIGVIKGMESNFKIVALDTKEANMVEGGPSAKIAGLYVSSTQKM